MLGQKVVERASRHSVARELSRGGDMVLNGGKKVVERVSALLPRTWTRGLSTRSSQDYLRQWLGNDMSGETYHSRIMAAAKARYENDLQQQQQSQGVQTQTSAALSEVDSDAQVMQSYAMASVPFPVIQVPPLPLASETDDLDHVEAYLSEMVSQAEVDGKFCVLDLADVDVTSSSMANFEELLSRVLSSSSSSLGRVLGVVNFQGEGDSLGTLPVLPSPISNSSSGSSGSSSVVQQQQQQSAPEPVAQAAAPMVAAPSRAHVHYGTVRSGQQVYAEKASLIVIGGVNDGGEVLADGDIHVYGPLKGRAVAGLGGGPDGANACVFARSFGPSLVGVNEVFIAPDDHAAAKQFLDREVVVRASGAKNFSNGVGARLPSVEIDGVSISLLPLS